MSIQNNRQLLLDALRSGEYEQGIALRHDYLHLERKRHCPLGVACEVFKEHYQGPRKYEWREAF